MMLEGCWRNKSKENHVYYDVGYLIISIIEGFVGLVVNALRGGFNLLSVGWFFCKQSAQMQ
ncbi:hypothetical protein [Serratia odorifera]|uniref:hypothetical protein n=1 Tax=Serratia odorifera TaxID=618 RepID=UPI0018E8A130|nr:hypothetical protein [Serratia odorifera]MBJ2067207.1 hypothetical protein [Serratia odorifera]HEJ9097421.1 hypothetical protein [Serratia odorifera]